MSETSPLDNGKYSCEVTVEKSTVLKTFEVEFFLPICVKLLNALLTLNFY